MSGLKMENIILGAVLCFAGGAMDGYSYCVQGGILVAAQTGNLLLLTLHIVEGSFKMSLGYIVSVICFIVAAFMSRLIQEKFFWNDTVRWQRCLLLIEFFVFLVVGFWDERIQPIYVIAVLSFLTTMQYCTFRSFGEGAPFATVFCTGNIRSLMDNVYEGLVNKNQISKKRASGYGIMLLCFVTGAACGSLLSKAVGNHAIWLACVAILIAWLLLCKSGRLWQIRKYLYKGSEK